MADVQDDAAARRIDVETAKKGDMNQNKMTKRKKEIQKKSIEFASSLAEAMGSQLKTRMCDAVIKFLIKGKNSQ